MKTSRYWLRFLSAYISRFRALILIGIVGGVVIFVVVNVLIPRFFMENTTIIGLTGRYTPDSLPTSIIEDISDGLTELDADGVVEPNLAARWETPDKGKTWFFYLKDGVTWQDGKKVKSQDINYHFTDVVVETPDENTIVFKLKDPFSPFPSVVSKPVFKTGFLGTGEWKVTDVSITGTFIESITILKKGEGKIVYKFFPSEERTKLAFKMGHVDQISEIIEPSPLSKWDTVDVKKDVKKSQIVTLFFNNDDALFKDNKDLRQALNYGVDKDKFDGERAIGPIPPFSWVYNPQVKPYLYNKERAQELIKNKKEEIKIKLVTSPVLLSTAESIAKDWEAIGIKSVIQISSVIPTDFQAYLAILDVPKDPDQYSIWHSTQKDSGNISKLTSPRIDKLLEDGRIELNNETRRQIYLDFQRYIAEEVPAAFLYHPVTYTIKRK